jgi:hypothetical protein
MREGRLMASTALAADITSDRTVALRATRQELDADRDAVPEALVQRLALPLGEPTGWHWLRSHLVGSVLTGTQQGVSNDFLITHARVFDGVRTQQNTQVAARFDLRRGDILETGIDTC